MNFLIAINAYAPYPPPRQARRIAEELENRGVRTKIERNGFFRCGIRNGKVELDGKPDACVYLDKDKYTARMLEKSGVRLFDRAAAIELCDDKMLTHIALSERGIPMPDTLPAPLCYDDGATPPASMAEKIEAELGYPLVVKQSYGSLGKGVYLARNREELMSLMDRLKTEPHLFQKYVASSHGKDMRVIVIGGKAVGAIVRQSNGDFRSNIGLGGSAKKADVPKDIRAIAESAASALDLDYCGIDILLGDTPLLCEVNSNAFFDAFEAVTDINVAALYAEHMIKTMKRSFS